MKTVQELISFIQSSPTAFHAVDTVKKQLKEAGFQELLESEDWDLKEAGGYYVTRNGSSLIAFRIPKGEPTGFQIGASHSDSPSFRVKAQMELDVQGHYTRLNVEPYGGAIYSSWLDRPLSVAGRAVVRSGSCLESRLVHIDRDLLMIPEVAIHMNREVNKGYNWNAQTDMLPLFGSEAASGQFRKLIAAEAGVDEDDLCGMDLFLYCRTPGTIWGMEEEYVSAPRLDDLQCAFGLLKGFLAADRPVNVPVYALFDNEEVGSLTKQGADSTFLEDVLKRIGGSNYRRMVAGSFLVSADNAHAVHPAHPELSDPLNKVYMNAGIVIKFNGNQKYTSDGMSEAAFRIYCEKAEVPCQTFTNRSDMAGGSTLGNLSNGHVSVNAVDIGLPQLSMHSCYETAGAKDTEYLCRVMELFFGGAFEELGAGTYRVL